MNNDTGSKGISYTGGFFILIVFALSCIILSQVINGFIWTAMTGLPAKEIETAMVNPATSNAYNVMQAILALIGFLVPAIFAAMILSRKPFRLLGFPGRPNAKEIGLVLLVLVGALMVSTGLTYVTEQIPIEASLKEKFEKMESDYIRRVLAILQLNNFGEYVLAMIVMAFLPAFCEETLFRGGLQNFLTRATRSPLLSIIIVSLLFSVFHISYYGFLSRFLLGFVLGFIFHYSGKLWLSILLHFLNNALIVTLMYVAKLQGQSMERVVAEKNEAWQGLLALPALIGLLYWFYKITRRNENPSHGI